LSPPFHSEPAADSEESERWAELREVSLGRGKESQQEGADTEVQSRDGKKNSA
jgi:hypothetical protein